ncbi:MAG: lantibiotic dehydratase [Pseudonocardiaceae bacterium]
MGDLPWGAPGSTALVRMAGLPVRLWCSGGCPELFGLLADAEELAVDYHQRAQALAEWIGSVLVPHAGLSRLDRHDVLRLRRTLHNGQQVPVAQASALAVLIDQSGGPTRRIADDLLATLDCGQRLEAAEARFAEAFDAEQRRVQQLPWELVRSSTTAGAAVATDVPQLIGEIEQRLANSERWDSKRLRHRAGYLWRLVARGTVKTTPRSWFGQVAVVAVDSCRESPDLLVGPAGEQQPTAGAQATHQLSNVYWSRTGGAGGAALSLPGLHWTDGEHLVCWVVDAQHNRMRQLRLRNTPILHTIRQALADGPRRRGELIAQLSGPQADRIDVLAGFLDHLAGLGVLQAGATRTERLSGWQQAPSRPARPEAHLFTDVYRQVSGVVSGTATGRIQRGMETALRLDALLHTARPRQVHPAIELIDAEPRPVTDLIRQYLHHHPQWTATPGTARHRLGWPAPIPGSGYARLHTMLENRVSPEPVVINDELLDALGAPAAPLTWPIDALVRPLPASCAAVAVLEAAVPAGALDARFAAALGQLQGELPQVSAYREFLSAVERELDGQFVELLCPPLSDRAANAVARPRYTRLHTGDPAHADYYCPGSGSSEYLPLQQITLRRAGSRIVAETRGRLLWPICHTARVARPPWDVVHALLGSAAMAGRSRGRTLAGALAAFPERDQLPRIVVGDVLVTARAQWRISRTELWTRSADPRVSVRALARLMRQRELPRWVFLRAHGRRSIPVDLLSLLSIHQLDRMLADPDVAELIAEEMLPSPGQFLLSDTAHAPGDRLAAQLLLRLPVDLAPAEQAHRACATWHPTEPLVAAMG